MLGSYEETKGAFFLFIFSVPFLAGCLALASGICTKLEHAIAMSQLSSNQQQKFHVNTSMDEWTNGPYENSTDCGWLLSQ